MVVLAIITLSLAVALPNLSLDVSDKTPDLVRFMQNQQRDAIETGKTHKLILQENKIVSIFNEQAYELSEARKVVMKTPKPSRYLSYALVTIFYPDGTAIDTEFEVTDNTQSNRNSLNFNIKVNPFDGTVSYTVF